MSDNLIYRDEIKGNSFHFILYAAKSIRDELGEGFKAKEAQEIKKILAKRSNDITWEKYSR